MRILLLTIAMSAALLFLTGCGTVITPTLQLSSSAFEHGGRIPVAHTCDGANLSPPLSWSAPPEGTASLAVIMDDPDARGFVHWVLFDLPPDVQALAGGIPPDQPIPGGAVQGAGGGGVGYFGPCPPEHRGPHRYSLRVYALDSHLGLPKGASKAEVDAAMRGHILAMGELVGVYERPQP